MIRAFSLNALTGGKMSISLLDISSYDQVRTKIMINEGKEEEWLFSWTTDKSQ